MAWTAPVTWLAGSTLTAAQLNEQVRDNSLAGGPIYATTAARDAAISAPFAGQRAVVTASNTTYQYNGTAWVALPQGRIAGVSVTAAQTGISAVADLTGLTATFTAVTGVRYKVTGYAHFYYSGGSPTSVYFAINQGATNLHSAQGGASGAYYQYFITQYVNTFTAGSTTVKLVAAASPSGTIVMQASATLPACIVVEDLGSA